MPRGTLCPVVGGGSSDIGLHPHSEQTRLFPERQNGNITYHELDNAFQWNAEFKSAFKEMQTEKMHGGPLQIISETPAKFVEALTKRRRGKSPAESESS